jgi:hypothetical protein
VSDHRDSSTRRRRKYARLVRCASVVLLLAACGEEDPCPHHLLEIRTFEGSDINGSTMSCNGSSWCPWQQPATAASVPYCESDAQIALASNLGGQLSLHLVVVDGVVTGARAQSREGCDEAECTTSYYEASSGWVMPQETILGGRMRGRYSLTFTTGFTAGGLMQGTYDTQPMALPADAGQP